MLNTVKKIWHDPVWSKVIATAIIVATGAYFFPWWQRVSVFIEKTYSLLGQQTSVINWFLGIMALCTILVIIVLVLAAWSYYHPPNSSISIPEWKIKYKEDIFFNIRWRWSYSDKNAVTNINSFCPKCDLQIHSSNTSGFRMIDAIVFECEFCNTRTDEFNESYLQLENKVERFIHQKIRNNTWNLV